MDESNPTDDIIIEGERGGLGGDGLAALLRLLLQRCEEHVEHLVRVLLIRVDTPAVGSAIEMVNIFMYDYLSWKAKVCCNVRSHPLEINHKTTGNKTKSLISTIYDIIFNSIVYMS